MGANESAEVQVNFNHPNFFYSAGEQITGNITFQSTHDKLTLDGIFLEFIGELGFTTRETKQQRDSNGRTRAEPFTEYHRKTFINVCFGVVQPQYGQHEVTLYRGQYTWPFQFMLPECLPPSSVPLTIEYPYVKYFMRVVLNKPWYKSNKKQHYPLIIFPRVNLNQIPSSQQPVPFTHSNRKKLQIDGYLLHGGFLPGRKLSFQINVQNPKRCEVKKVVATLIQHRQIAQTHHSEIIFRTDLDGLHEFSEIELNRTYDLQIPSAYLAPTYTYIAQCCAASINVNFSYELKLDVKVRGLFTDFTLRVPLIIGSEPNSDQPELTNSYFEMPPPSAPVYDFEELPPSYESVVSNLKQ